MKNNIYKNFNETLFKYIKYIIYKCDDYNCFIHAIVDNLRSKSETRRRREIAHWFRVVLQFLLEDIDINRITTAG